MRKRTLIAILLLLLGVAVSVTVLLQMDRGTPLSGDSSLPADLGAAGTGLVDDSAIARPESDPHRRHPGLQPSPLDQLNSPDTTPQDDVRLLALLFADYSSVFKRVPLGMHSEIVAALKGDNPRSIRYIPEGHPAVSADNEIVDRWGRPYFFHVISRNAVEIISAGPDGELFTADDIRDVPPNASVEPELTMLP